MGAVVGALKYLAAENGDASIARGIRRRQHQDDVRLVRANDTVRDDLAGERAADAAPAATDVRGDLEPLQADHESVGRRQPDHRIVVVGLRYCQAEGVVAEVAPRRPIVVRGQNAEAGARDDQVRIAWREDDPIERRGACGSRGARGEHHEGACCGKDKDAHVRSFRRTEGIEPCGGPQVLGMAPRVLSYEPFFLSLQ